MAVKGMYEDLCRPSSECHPAWLKRHHRGIPSQKTGRAGNPPFTEESAAMTFNLYARAPHPIAPRYGLSIPLGSEC